MIWLTVTTPVPPMPTMRTDRSSVGTAGTGSSRSVGAAGAGAPSRRAGVRPGPIRRSHDMNRLGLVTVMNDGQSPSRHE